MYELRRSTMNRLVQAASNDSVLLKAQPVADTCASARIHNTRPWYRIRLPVLVASAKVYGSHTAIVPLPWPASTTCHPPNITGLCFIMAIID